MAVDASQIEARICGVAGGEDDFAGDVCEVRRMYKAFASEIFSCCFTLWGRCIGLVGKTCILGLGFGMSNKLLFSHSCMSLRQQGIHFTFAI